MALWLQPQKLPRLEPGALVRPNIVGRLETAAWLAVKGVEVARRRVMPCLIHESDFKIVRVLS